MNASLPDPFELEDGPRDPAAGSVDLRAEEHVAVIELNRPRKMNAITPEMLNDLEQAVARVDAASRIRVVVVMSAGDVTFCAGADIHRFKVLDGVAMWSSWTRRGHQVFDRLAALRQPTVAAMDGNAFGGGLELALACDLRILAKGSTLGLTEVGLGTVPGWGGTSRLPQQIGVTRAKEMVLTGKPIKAATALEWGLVNDVVHPDMVKRQAMYVAGEIADQAPVAVQMAKQAMDISVAGSSGMTLEGIAAAATAGLDDFAEGLSAFSERRRPVFTGGTRQPLIDTPTKESHDD